MFSVVEEKFLKILVGEPQAQNLEKHICSCPFQSPSGSHGKRFLWEDPFPIATSQDKWEWGRLSRQPAGSSDFDTVLPRNILHLERAPENLRTVASKLQGRFRKKMQKIMLESLCRANLDAFLHLHISPGAILHFYI